MFLYKLKRIQYPSTSSVYHSFIFCSRSTLKSDECPFQTLKTFLIETYFFSEINKKLELLYRFLLYFVIKITLKISPHLKSSLILRNLCSKSKSQIMAKNLKTTNEIQEFKKY